MQNGAFVFTTNVDGQFQKAGFAQGRVCEVHGSIHHLQPADPAAVLHEWQRAGAAAKQPNDINIVHRVNNTPLIASADHVVLDVNEESLTVPAGQMPLWPSPTPTCSTQQLARPNILMYCDESFVAGRQRHQVQAFKDWVGNSFGTGGTVVLDMGSGTAVPTSRITSEQVAAQLKAPLIRINPRESQLPQSVGLNLDTCISLPCGALEGLQAIHEHM
jgi:NAD-dependent SIR2 family protein deacetylase